MNALRDRVKLTFISRSMLYSFFSRPLFHCLFCNGIGRRLNLLKQASHRSCFAENELAGVACRSKKRGIPANIGCRDEIDEGIGAGAGQRTGHVTPALVRLSGHLIIPRVERAILERQFNIALYDV